GRELFSPGRGLLTLLSLIRATSLPGLAPQALPLLLSVIHASGGFENYEGLGMLPVDAVVAKAFAANVPSRVVAVDSVGGDEMILDIGPRSIKPCSRVKTLVWNGRSAPSSSNLSTSARSRLPKPRRSSPLRGRLLLWRAAVTPSRRSMRPARSGGS